MCIFIHVYINIFKLESKREQKWRQTFSSQQAFCLSWNTSLHNHTFPVCVLASQCLSFSLSLCPLSSAHSTVPRPQKDLDQLCLIFCQLLTAAMSCLIISTLYINSLSQGSRKPPLTCQSHSRPTKVLLIFIISLGASIVSRTGFNTSLRLKGK